MKYSIILTIIVAICFPGIGLAAVGVPTNLALTSTETTITVTWSANDDDATGYKIYWGESSGNLSNTITVDDAETESATISNLLSNKTYYAAMSAYNSGSESARTTVLSISTKTDAPATPTNLDITSPDDISDTVVPLMWNHNSEDDISHYLISYRNANSSTSFTPVETGYVNTLDLSGLTLSTRYYIKIAAVDTSGNASSYSAELVVDTTPDMSAPFAPQSVKAAITAEGNISISFNANNGAMADFKGCRVYCRKADEAYDIDRSKDAGEGTSATFYSLTENITYYFVVRAYDHTGNESESIEVSEMIEPTRTLLSETGSFGGGCFVGATDIGETDDVGNAAAIMILAFFCGCMLILVPGRAKKTAGLAMVLSFFLCADAFCQDMDLSANYQNLAGVKLGYFAPSESLQDDIYGDNPFPFFIFYERSLFLGLSADVALGYSRREGHGITGAGESTDLETKLTLVPFSTTLNWNLEITPLIHVFVGGGLDYWYYLEETDTAKYDASDDDYGVGGYHIKTGGKFFTGSKTHFKQFGILLETVYSKIDRFGNNKTDLGGWLFNIGAFYSF